MHMSHIVPGHHGFNLVISNQAIYVPEHTYDRTNIKKEYGNKTYNLMILGSVIVCLISHLHCFKTTCRDFTVNDNNIHKVQKYSISCYEYHMP